MRYRLLPILMALLLFFIPVCAEPTEDASLAENLFYGTWQLSYLVQDGELVTDNEDLPTMFVFDENTVTAYYPNDDPNPSSCEYAGNTCSARSEQTHFFLESEDLIIGSEEGFSFILTRIDPLLLNNPFIGTWIPLCVVENGNVRDLSEWSHTAFSVFSANTVQLIDGDYEDVYPCTYADGACTLFEEDQVYMICTISEDGLLYMANPHDSNAYQLICAKEDEVTPEEITQFFGAWQEIAALRNGLLITDQMPQAQRPFENTLLFRYDFSRAAVLRSCPEHADNPTSWILCTYADDTCTILYDDVPVLCTIDRNGLMCMRSEDGDAIWLVRMEEATPAEAE